MTHGRAVASLGRIRLSIGEKVVLGLEFFIAGVVAIRTAIAYFLDLEMRGRVRTT